jgi:hypothetical protein
VLGEKIVVEVAHDEAQLDLGRVALEEHGWTYPSRPSVVSGERLS